MEASNYEIIQAMYDELKKEKENSIFSLEKIKSEIDEIDVYLNGLHNKENGDLKVFLPRKVENIYHDKIDENKRRREELISKSDKLEKQLYLTKNRITKLEKVLSDSSMSHVKKLSILDAQEKERQRIARDLHDTSLQNLTHLVHKVELSSLYIDSDPIRAKLELAIVEKGIRKVIDEIRCTIFDLRPMSFDDLGLREAIEKLLFVSNIDHKFHIVTDIDEISLLSSNYSMRIVFISIYRMVQECVQNSIKHSGGDRIVVKLKDCDDSYMISVQDNGKGFDLEEAMKKDRHFGLSVIKERVFVLGGKLNINTTDGTLIEIMIPKGD